MRPIRPALLCLVSLAALTLAAAPAEAGCFRKAACPSYSAVAVQTTTVTVFPKYGRLRHHARAPRAYAAPCVPAAFPPYESPAAVYVAPTAPAYESPVTVTPAPQTDTNPVPPAAPAKTLPAAQSPAP